MVTLGIFESGGLRRLTLGTRISEYRCSLPGLAGFSTYRREEPTETTIETGELRQCLKLAEREGFEPSIRGLAVYTLSRRAPSTARTSLHWNLFNRVGGRKGRAL